MSTHAVQRERQSVVHVRIFQVIIAADAISILGTALARFALAYLVFDRTNSATASALTYAATYLPSAAGGFLLGWLGDRYSERTVMVGCDLVRAVLIGTMALPGTSIAVIVALLVVAVFLDPAFDAAELALLRRRLSLEQLRASSALRAAVDQVAQIGGFAAAGAVVAVVGPSAALAIDAATFALSAALVIMFLPRRTASAAGTGGPSDDGPTAPSPDDAPQFRGLWRDPRTRGQMCFTMLIGLYVLPEALAVAFANQIGASTTQAGLLLAMEPLGIALGYALIARVPARLRAGVGKVMAVTCGLPLLLCAAGPPFSVACTSWFVCGLLTAYQVDVLIGLVRAIPDEATSRSLGFVSAWLTISQGAAFAAGGALTAWIAPGAVVATAGTAGCLAAFVLVGRGARRTSSGAGRHRSVVSVQD